VLVAEKGRLFGVGQQYAAHPDDAAALTVH
jgi:hypothetical protein